MAVCRNQTKQWLSQLKSLQLHQLAIAVGSPCSGNKRTVADGISQILSSRPREKLERTEGSELRSASLLSTDTAGRRDDLSIISIDMGIQNLAYAHVLAPGSSIRGPGPKSGSGIVPTLGSWERLTVFPVEEQDRWPTEKATRKAATGAFYSPSRYADAAHRFVTMILEKYDPTHILIEQQRFRSGGASAVAEWTIRVGVFEGMIHAILRTLQHEANRATLGLQAVESINPAKTARFWLESKKITGKEGKQAKVDLVGQSFLSRSSKVGQMIEIGSDGAQAQAMKNAFVERWLATSKSAKLTAKSLKAHERPSPSSLPSSSTLGDQHSIEQPKLSKLDDLADCLLQALAWLEWQRMKELVLQDLQAHDPAAAIQQRLCGLDERQKTGQK